MVEEAVDDAEEESKAWKTYSDKSQMSKSELEKDWHKLVNISIF